jgi:hypothetical protein
MAKQEAQRRHRVGGMDGGGSDLGEERLKDEVVIVVDQLDIEFVAATPPKPPPMTRTFFLSTGEKAVVHL